MENNPNTLDLHNVPPIRPSEPTQSPQMPEMPEIPRSKKFGSKLLWIVLTVAVLGAGLAWWYISRMSSTSVVEQPQQIDQEARQDTLINNEIQGIDLGDLDKEFEEIDKDIESL